MASYTGTSGTDTFTGTTGDDVFSFAVANLTATDTIDGNGGTDALSFTTAGAISAAKLGGVYNINVITFGVAGSTVTLDNSFASHNGPALKINATSGNDAVDASAVTNANFALSVFGSDGNDSYRGGAGADVFRFTAAQLNASDLVSGGNGAAIDTLIINGAGTLAASAFTQVSGIEQITLAVGGVTVNLGSSFPSTGTLVVNGSSGNDTIDASAMSDTTHAIAVTAGAGSDSFKGGAGDDSFRFAAGELTSADTVAGNGGTDTLILTGTGPERAADLVHVSGIDVVTFAAAGSSLVLDDAFAAQNGPLLKINSSSGSDAVDATGVTNANFAISVFASDGSDLYRGGAGADVFRFAPSQLTSADQVKGGTGAAIDTIIITTAGSVAASAFTQVSEIEALTLAVGGISVTLDDRFPVYSQLTINGSSGNDTVDASAVADPLHSISVFAGTGSDMFKGGAGADTFRFVVGQLTSADTVAGNGGTDSLIFSGTGTVNAADLAHVSGIEALTMAPAGSTVIFDNGFAAANATSPLQVITGGGNDVLDASAVTLANFTLSVFGGAGNDTFKGGAGNDIFRFNATDLSSADTVSGGAGYDTLIIKTAGTITQGALQHVSGIDAVVLAQPTRIDLGNTLGESPVLKVFGSAGDDHVSAGIAVDFTAGAGNDTINTNAGSIARFAANEITSGDTVLARTLVITTAGTVGLDALQHVSVSGYTLGVGGITLNLSDGTDHQGTSNQEMQITGSSGNDSVNGYGSGYALVFDGDAGSDNFIGGDNGDTFRFSATNLTAADAIDGSSNLFSTIDKILITSGGALSVDAFAHVTGIEQLYLSDLGNAVTLTDALVASASGGTMTVYGGALGDTIDASAVGASHPLTIRSGGGADVVTGGAGNDTIISGDGQDTINAGDGNDYVDGQGGADTIDLGGGIDGYTYDPNDISVAGGAGNDTLVAYNVGGTFNFSFADQTVGDTALVSGFENFVGHGTDATITRTIIGTSAQQTITGDIASEYIDGDGGTDTISGGYSGDGTHSVAGADRIAYHATETALYAFCAGHAPGDYDMSFAYSTLVLLAPVTVDINASDQTVGDSTLVEQFMNVDASALTAGVTVIGGSIGTFERTQTIIGGSGSDTLTGATQSISGNGGDDFLSGASSEFNGPYASAMLTGGSGHDTFAMSAYSNPVVTDFSSVDDTIQWSNVHGDANFNGAAFDTVVTDTTGHANLASADLIRYSAGALDTAAQVSSYLSSNGTLPSSSYGVFVLAEDAQGDIVLWHNSNAGGAHTNIAAVFQNIGLSEIQLSDFSFV